MFGTSWRAASWYVSADLAKKIRLGIDELAIVREQMGPLIALPSNAPVGVMETNAACAMLHSFYTEIEKLLTIIAREWDGKELSSASWHKDLLNQMATATEKRPAILSTALVEVLSEFLAFRHLFRGASIALMRWAKLSPLLAKASMTYDQTAKALEEFVRFMETRAE